MAQRFYNIQLAAGQNETKPPAVIRIRADAMQSPVANVYEFTIGSGIVGKVCGLILAWWIDDEL